MFDTAPHQIASSLLSSGLIGALVRTRSRGLGGARVVERRGFCAEGLSIREVNSFLYDEALDLPEGHDTYRSMTHDEALAVVGSRGGPRYAALIFDLLASEVHRHAFAGDVYCTRCGSGSGDCLSSSLAAPFTFSIRLDSLADGFDALSFAFYPATGEFYMTVGVFPYEEYVAESSFEESLPQLLTYRRTATAV